MEGRQSTYPAGIEAGLGNACENDEARRAVAPIIAVKEGIAN